MEKNEYYMKRALELAAGGWGRTNPNPLVGALIVKNGEIIAEGCHEKLGGAHAEVAALKNARQDVKGGTLYVNLEPCSHYGRTPPCAEAVIKAGISKVVIAMEDPNPKVCGKGVEMLKNAGIETVTGVLEGEARRLNEIFIKYVTRKQPFVILKAAMTLDGKIATAGGDSKWISGEGSRQQVHLLRDRVSAIMVGVDTVLADDPALTARPGGETGNDPVRIIVDSKGKIPIDSRVINNEAAAGTILATTSAIEAGKEKLLLEKGVRLLKLDGPDGHVDLEGLLEQLYGLELDSVLLEGGGGLNAAALAAGIVDKAMIFIAPKIIGGRDAKTPVEGDGIGLMRDALRLGELSIVRFEEDILIEGYIRYK
ncbi:riboflavin biosynthesis protein RibD [Ruminiclostridium hungatei]|uniref:Riboflavin biosynthesis protein RibD n=1 Tax=Ruminiclostridium hungatei TaxID=48256 RepID=A0A1V4SNL1_RUMHU|nr:bifunctional diaminohydroxyphosphoribosylaminopyrimidine deaminase/5-amino-6-(5-phosphoribosylamino)uracil reductase RibD [Ruminiclostridium hungatei]OPX45479.1 riboflavin biosynthesis protein RibD [Ruminiclostridium hungatei]